MRLFGVYACSDCGQPWKDCTHVSFGDIYGARRATVLRWAALATIIALIVGGFFLAVMSS